MDFQGDYLCSCQTEHCCGPMHMAFDSSSRPCLSEDQGEPSSQTGGGNAANTSVDFQHARRTCFTSLGKTRIGAWFTVLGLQPTCVTV
jgi:hypothetical protein